MFSLQEEGGGPGLGASRQLHLDKLGGRGHTGASLWARFPHLMWVREDDTVSQGCTSSLLLPPRREEGWGRAFPPADQGGVICM